MRKRYKYTIALIAIGGAVFLFLNLSYVQQWDGHGPITLVVHVIDSDRQPISDCNVQLLMPDDSMEYKLHVESRTTTNAFGIASVTHEFDTSGIRSKSFFASRNTMHVGWGGGIVHCESDRFNPYQEELWKLAPKEFVNPVQPYVANLTITLEAHDHGRADDTNQSP